jgi:glycosyltransferase involved in cell wall biosynthesis
VKILHYMRAVRAEEGGVVRAVLNLCAVQARAGLDVALVTFDPKDVPAEWRSGASGLPRLIVIDPPSRPLSRLGPGAIRAADEQIRRADIVHLHAVWTPSNVQLASLARRAGRPYVQSLHGMMDDWSMSTSTLKKRLFLALGGRNMLERAAVIHCTAELEREQSPRWFRHSQRVVVPLIVDLEPFRSPPGRGPAQRAFPAVRTNEPILLFLSRIHPVKGLDILIRAVDLLRARAVPCRLLIAGGGEPDHVAAPRALADQLNLTDRVHFLGIVSGAEKVSLYQCADLFVLPSLHENFGFVLPEALAVGVPCVTTRSVGLWSELEQGGGAVIADRTPEGLAEAIAPLLADPARRRAMGDAGRRWVFENLDETRVVAKFRDLYQSALAPPAPRP